MNNIQLLNVKLELIYNVSNFCITEILKFDTYVQLINKYLYENNHKQEITTRISFYILVVNGCFWWLWTRTMVLKESIRNGLDFRI